MIIGLGKGKVELASVDRSKVAKYKGFLAGAIIFAILFPLAVFI